MTTRQQRRQEERLARKQALKAEKTLAAPQAPATAKDSCEESSEPNGFVPQPSTRAEINRQNAQHSTGPQTPEGKAHSSQNAVRHGLASNLFLILPWENGDDFDVLLANLRAEHRPTTQTEALLVEKMAQHFWLSQRALHLQEICFHRDAPLCDQPKDLALYLRYGTTHDRAFQKCIDQLAKLRAARQKEEAGFVSQQRQQAAETRKQELHQARIAALTAKIHTKKQDRQLKTATTADSPATEQPHFPPTAPHGSPLEQSIAA